MKNRYTTDIYTLDNDLRCNKAQGASIKGKQLSASGRGLYFVRHEWIWCALTRSTYFKDVLFYEGATNNGKLNEENVH